MGIPYHPRIKTTVKWNGDTHLSRQGQSQTNTVNAQDYGNSVLGPAWCFAGGLYATKNNDQFRCLLCISTEIPKSISKQMAWHAIKRCFAPPQ
ncbi:hypothetical protein TNCV_1695401 [Trichonephila clavipes]|nr:hypothetical protein TNCV_1695401 [Trichonephila clavipes]